MTEKEKMLTEELYNAGDEQLLRERKSARQLTFELNNLPPGNMQKRTEILKKLLGACGTNITIEGLFNCDYGYNITVGENFYANYNLVILDVAKVNIGDNVFIGPNVGIYTACHPLDAAERITGLEYGKPISIGNNVWIGGNVSILPGATIGDNTVIGAGSVVTKNIPAGFVAAGNPCKAIKKL